MWLYGHALSTLFRGVTMKIAQLSIVAIAAAALLSGCETTNMKMGDAGA